MRRKTQGILVTAVGIGCLWASAALALNWPATSATLVGSANSLGAGYEPSGIVALADGRVAMVGDDGDVTLMSQEGQIIGNWSPGGDLEGITEIGDGYVYVAVEHPDTIKQFNLSTGQFPGKSWDLTGWLKGSDNLGMEALTFVPNGHHPYVSGLAGGLFYAGLQADGKIYVINVDLTTTNAAELVDVIDLGKTSDISGLDFDVDTGLMYALYDGYNELLEATPAGEILKTYSVVGNDQEGIALVPNCETGTASVFIAEDVGPEVWRYSPYPITCQVEVPPVVEEPPIEEDRKSVV